jgi:FkbM family methyltransferase
VESLRWRHSRDRCGSRLQRFLTDAPLRGSKTEVNNLLFSYSGITGVLNRVLGLLGLRVVRDRGTVAGSLRWLRTQDISVSTVIDVGASNGSWSRLCMKAGFPSADYLLIEPNSVHQKLLADFARANQRVQICAKAASSFSGQTGFRFSADDPLAGALTERHDDQATAVPCTTIDCEVRDRALSGPYLIKLDTHGYEKEILTGAGATLINTSVLIIEAYVFELTNTSWLFWELCDDLRKLGFRCVDLVDPLWRPFDGALWQFDLVFVRSEWDGFLHRNYS